MHLEIVSPSKTVFSGEVELVLLPGSNGAFEILRNHAPIIAALSQGKLKIKDKQGKETFFDISSGVVEVLNNTIVVLAEAA